MAERRPLVGVLAAAVACLATTVGSACKSTSSRVPRTAPSPTLVGVWEDESPSLSGQMPGGNLWDFRADGTYSMLSAVIADTPSTATTPTPSFRTKTTDCSWFAQQVTADGISHARIIFDIDERGGSYVLRDNVVTLKARYPKQGGEYRVVLSPSQATLSEVGSDRRYKFVRVGWYKLPAADVIRACSLK